MKRPRRLSQGFEAISFQGSSLLFKELTMAFTELTAELPVDTKKFNKANIEKIIFNRTGLNVNIFIDKDRSPNAYVYPPKVDKNNPIVNYWWVELGATSSKDSLKKIKKTKDSLKSLIDLKNSKVSGFYSEIKCRMGITYGLINSGTFTPAEISSIVLHELGHLFSYFESLEFMLTSNVTIRAAMDQYFSVDTAIRRHEIITETSKVLDIDFEDPDTLTDIKSKEVFQTLVLREAMRQNKSSLGSEIYDYTAWEAASDQFSSRHGAGRDLVTALDKLSKLYGDVAYRSTVKHVILNIIGVALFLAALGMGFIPVLIILFINPAIKDYDPTKARMTRIRQELAAGLKDPNLEKDVKEKIVQDVKVIDSVTTLIEDKRGVLELIHTSLLPKGRKQYSQLTFQKDLERLINNDMFVMAAKFETLKI